MINPELQLGGMKKKLTSLLLSVLFVLALYFPSVRAQDETLIADEKRIQPPSQEELQNLPMPHPDADGLIVDEEIRAWDWIRMTPVDFPLGFPEPKTFSFSGDPIVLDYVLFNEEQTQSGLMLFLDGIPQPFTIFDPLTGVETELSTMHLLTVDGVNEKKVQLKFTPMIGKKGEPLGLYLVPVTGAQWALGAPERLYAVANWIFPISGLSVSMETDADESGLKLRDVTPEEVDIPANSSARHETYYGSTFYSPDEEVANRLHVTDAADTVPVRFSHYGGPAGCNRVTFFANHEPVEIDGATTFEYDYVEKKYAEWTVDFPVDDLPQYATIYAINAPCGDLYMKEDAIIQITPFMKLVRP